MTEDTQTPALTPQQKAAIGTMLMMRVHDCPLPAEHDGQKTYDHNYKCRLLVVRYLLDGLNEL